MSFTATLATALKRALQLTLPLLLFLLMRACSDVRHDREAFIVSVVKKRPEMELQDLYKLLYQARFGIGHLISSREHAAAYLKQEIASVRSAWDGTDRDTANLEEALIESCSVDSRMVRINLRPFVRQGLDQEELLDAMMETAAQTVPDSALLRRDWQEVGEMIRRAILLYKMEDYAELTRMLQERHFPAVHHSERYSRAYQPAYRVVLRAAIIARLKPAQRQGDEDGDELR